MSSNAATTPYHAPNAAAYIERLIGTFRRECLDHLLIWNERHLRLVLTELVAWYNGARVHQGIHAIPAPDPDLIKPLLPSTAAHLIARPVLGGLHHNYRLVA